jgi:hypothetical protein
MASCLASINAILDGSGSLKTLMECTGSTTHTELVFTHLYPYVQLVLSGAVAIDKKMFENKVMLGITSFETYNTDHATYLRILSDPGELVKTLGAIVSQFGTQLTKKDSVPEKKLDSYVKPVNKVLDVLKLLARNWRYWLEKLITDQDNAEADPGKTSLPAWFSTNIYWCGKNEPQSKHVHIDFSSISQTRRYVPYTLDETQYNTFLRALVNYQSDIMETSANPQKKWIRTLQSVFTDPTVTEGSAAVNVAAVKMPDFFNINVWLKKRFFPTLRPIKKFCVPPFLLRGSFSGDIQKPIPNIINAETLLSFHLYSMRTLVFEKFLIDTKFQEKCVNIRKGKELKLLVFLKENAEKNSAQKTYLDKQMPKSTSNDQELYKAARKDYYSPMASKTWSLQTILQNLAYTICPSKERPNPSVPLCATALPLSSQPQSQLKSQQKSQQKRPRTEGPYGPYVSTNTKSVKPPYLDEYETD